jgi:hypothetical protein
MRFFRRGPQEGQSRQLPSSMVAAEFGEINVAKSRDKIAVDFTILMEPTGASAEGWQTGVAIDASGSMKGVFGKGLVPGRKGNPPQYVLQQYMQKGWMQLVPHQGQVVPILTEAAENDLVSNGYFTWSKNELEPMAREVTAYLAETLDEDGGTTVIYWACGDGNQIEVVGDLTKDDCKHHTFVGPNSVAFGTGTMLAPAVKYFVDRFRDAKRGMYVFITDGELNDLPQVKQLTTQLCKDIAAGRRNSVKCVLIGMGDAINGDQMEELDDLETGTNIDIWDHKIAKEMRSMKEIFAELADENKIVADTARVYDEQGNVVLNCADGLHAKERFTMPAASRFFELEVAGRRIRQSVVLPQ